ncbi:50S ribosomal protein L6 [Hyphomicrobium sulfonivorans]|uniref:Large ribosomal subunit protein uL6 n=1 Tax=Hyphomicrobium sulfonivorans TaxID=121290 RepID=A0A109BNB3_HYPSL|nr:50S ribosomal protein L6 [Hyphomicrobium sulfonivorans]KWT71974.1 LSU ribosomal protein L6p (L9e) [Hyphomicrobium sulfonivorans]MBI1650260.1 50S ribosomal protein L6 [Hyphomicrobium sulfonivorans]NSL72377.1 50S ribosomal protein L6 [Hyphomicrobium sulfonivorans]
MSRIGKKVVPVPSNVTATINGREIKVKGPKGELSFTVPDKINIEKTDDGIVVTPVDDTKMARSMWGMSRTMISNLVGGVTEGYSQILEIHGVGFRAAMKGKDLQLLIGFSHDVIHQIPDGVEVKVSGAKQEIITVTGIDRQLVGQVSANIRASRPPEPYQGKGIRYQGEYIFRKEGKKK